MKIIIKKELFDLYNNYYYEHNYGDTARASSIYDCAMKRDDLQRVFTECEKVQRKCRARCIQSKEQLWKYLVDIKEHLNNIPVLKRELDGTVVFFSPFACHNKPRSYKYEMEGTVLKLEYIKGYLYLTGVYRAECESDRIKVYLSDSAKESIIEKVNGNALFNER